MVNSRFGWHSGALKCKNITVENNMTIEGDLTFGDASTDTLTVNGEARFNARVRCLNRPLSADGYALEVKTDYDAASGTGQGALQVSTRVYPATDTTTINAQGGYVQCQLHADDAMTGGAMTGFLAQAHNSGGTLNGAAITVTALRAQLADGGTWTQVSRVSVLHVLSDLAQAVSSGTYNLLFIQNAGTTTAADAIAVDGNDKVSALMTLTNVSGAAAVANGSILNDISSTPNDGYIKVVVEGEDKYIALYDLKA